MKKLTTLLAASFCAVAFAQPQLAIDSMEINTLKANIYSDGGIWSLKTFDDSTHKTLLFTDGFWIGGYDGTTLHQSAQTYRQAGYDFVPGPISNDPSAITKYDKVYRVNLQTLTDFKNGTTQGIPQEIAEWPAHGDPNMGEAYYLAPFVDVNNDGNYNPADGDYPKIKGDEAIYTIFNDDNARTGVYTRENANPLGVEIHCLTYAYRTGGIEDSVLYREYRVINRSNTIYTNAYLSIWADFDLGNARDDLAGTHIPANSIYCYNADGDDEGPNGFGSNLASCGIRMLQGPPADYFDGIDNDKDGCVDGVRDANGNCISENPATGVREQILLSGSMYFNNNFAPQGNPNTPLDFYNYMNSLWKDGNNLIIETPSGFGSVQNGDGYVSSNTGTASKYIYPGNSYDTIGAYEPSTPTNWFESPNNSNDKRILANAGPFTLEAGEEFKIVTAYVWSRKPGHANSLPAIVNKLSYLDTVYNNPPARTVGLNAYQTTQHYLVSYDAASGTWLITNNDKSTLSFEVYSTTGQLMTRFKVDSDTKLEILTDGFAKGVYLLVETKTGQTQKITR